MPGVRLPDGSPKRLGDECEPYTFHNGSYTRQLRSVSLPQPRSVVQQFLTGRKPKKYWHLGGYAKPQQRSGTWDLRGEFLYLPDSREPQPGIESRGGYK